MVTLVLFFVMNKQLLSGKLLLIATLVIFSLVSLVPLNYISSGHFPANLFHIPFYLIFMAAAAALLALGAFIIEPKTSRYDLWLLLMIAGMSLSQLSSVDHSVTALDTASFAFKGLLFAFIAMRVFRDEENILFTFLLGTASAVSFLGLSEYFLGWNPYFKIAPALLDSLNRRPGIVSTIGHSIPLAAYLTMMLPLSIEYARKTRKIASYLPLILMSVTIFVSLSRSGWISALAALAIYFSQKEKAALKAHRKFLILFSVFIAAIFAVIPGARETLVNRTLSLRGMKADYSYTHRIAAYTTTMKILKDYPFFGVGMGNYPSVHEKYLAPGGHIMIKTPDNIYLRFLCETGLAGTIFFFTLLFLFFRTLWMNRNDDLVSAIFAGLAGFMINQFTADLFHWTVAQITFWLLLGVALYRIKANEQKTRT